MIESVEIPSSQHNKDSTFRIPTTVANSECLSSLCLFTVKQFWCRKKRLLTLQCWYATLFNDFSSEILRRRHTNMTYIKTLVSKKKNRHIEDGFNLDLTYISGKFLMLNFINQSPNRKWIELFMSPMMKHSDFIKILWVSSAIFGGADK